MKDPSFFFFRISAAKVSMVQRRSTPKQRTQFGALLQDFEYPKRRCRDLSLRSQQRRWLYIQREDSIFGRLWVWFFFFTPWPRVSLLNSLHSHFLADMEVFQDLTERAVFVESGDAVVLHLPEIESHPTPEVIWLTSDGPLDYNIKYANTANQHTLLILSASESDQGYYR